MEPEKPNFTGLGNILLLVALFPPAGIFCLIVYLCELFTQNSGKPKKPWGDQRQPRWFPDQTIPSPPPPVSKSRLR
jgi:hypothetical protein